MQSSIPKDNEINDGLDSAMDTIGVVLDSSVVCGKCNIQMESNDKVRYTCPTCEAKFVQEEES